MSKVITHEDFVNDVKKKHPHIDVIGRYRKMRMPIMFHCNIHDYDFEIMPMSILKSEHGCKYCAIDYVSERVRKTNDEFIKEVEGINPNTEIVGEYKTSHTKIKCKCKKCGNEWDSMPYSLIRGYGCKNCAMEYVQNYRIKSHGQFISEFNERNLNHRTIDIISRYTKDDEPITCRCKVCGHVWQTKAHNLIGKRSPSGCPICNTSKGELKILTFLENNDVNFEWQKSFSDLKGIGGGLLSYDFYLLDNNILIEYQGEFHDGTANSQSYEQLEYQKEHDRRKRKYANDNKIQLLEIWYKDFNNIEQILKDNLAA